VSLLLLAALTRNYVLASMALFALAPHIQLTPLIRTCNAAAAITLIVSFAELPVHPEHVLALLPLAAFRY